MRRRPNPESEANIRRIDTKARAKKQTHGFQLHFLRGSEVVTKMLSYSIDGGKEAARRAGPPRHSFPRPLHGPQRSSPTSEDVDLSNASAAVNKLHLLR